MQGAGSPAFFTRTVAKSVTQRWHSRSLTVPLQRPVGNEVRQEVWIVQSYCNRGSLLRAIEKGKLNEPDGTPDLEVILSTGGRGRPNQVCVRGHCTMLCLLLDACPYQPCSTGSAAVRYAAALPGPPKAVVASRLQQPLSRQQSSRGPGAAGCGRHVQLLPGADRLTGTGAVAVTVPAAATPSLLPCGVLGPRLCSLGGWPMP